MHSRSTARRCCEAEPKRLAAWEIHLVSGITAHRSVFPHEAPGNNRRQSQQSRLELRCISSTDCERHLTAYALQLLATVMRVPYKILAFDSQRLRFGNDLAQQAISCYRIRYRFWQHESTRFSSISLVKGICTVSSIGRAKRLQGAEQARTRALASARKRRLV